MAVVNPLRSRLFAEAGALAKTDRVDCRMLAILGQSLEPGATPPSSGFMESLRELAHCRDAAIAARTGLLNQLGATAARQATVEIKRQLRAAETAIENLDAEIERLIGADPQLARRLAILTFIPGVGATTAIALNRRPGRTWLPVGQRSRHQGRTRPCPPRLHMAPVSAARFNPAFKTFYDRLVFAKVLDGGRFQWPKIENGVMRLSAAQLSALVEGLDWKRVGAPKDTPAPRLPG